MKTTREAAAGRWRQILPALGIPATFLNGKHQPCPMCGGKDRARFDDRNLQGDFFCSRCGAGNGFVLLQRFHGWTYKQAADAIDKVIGKLPTKPAIQRKMQRTVDWRDIAQIWRTAKPIQEDDYAGAYLRSRALPGPWLNMKALRFYDHWKHAPSGKYPPCMVALFRDAYGQIGTIHRTYLDDVQPRRMFLPGGVPSGGAIRLAEPHEFMGVAEGIETALSCSILFKMPVWATTSELMLRRFRPPSMVRHLYIFGDNDRSFVGQRAAYELAARLRHEGAIKQISVEIPSHEDCDWNDLLRNEYHGG